MSNKWPKVRLGEVLTPVSRPVVVDPTTVYSILGAHWYAKGLYTKDILPGSQIQAKHLYRVGEGDFVYNRLFGWKGSFAIASNENQDCYVSNEFPCFVVKSECADGRYLWKHFSLPSVWDEVLSLSTGGTPTSRNRLKEEQLLAMEILLPPVAEQRRIVARIDELSAKVREARVLRQQAGEEAEAVIPSVLHRHFVVESKNWTPLRMEQVIDINDKLVNPTLPEFSQLPHISGENMESTTCRLLPWRTAEADSVKSNNYLFSPGTILYSKIRPYLRKAVFVEFAGVCSADVYPIRVSNPELDPQFVKWTLVAEPFTNYANRLSGRTRMPKLNRKQLFGFDFTHPPLPKQRQIVAHLDGLQKETDALKALQVETSAELDAFMPSILDKAFRGEM